MTSLTEQDATAWTPYGEWVATPETRRVLALHLAHLAGMEGMGDTVAEGLAQLAGHLEEPVRSQRFEAVVKALRGRGKGARALVNAAVADLCEPNRTKEKS